MSILVSHSFFIYCRTRRNFFVNFKKTYDIDNIIPLVYLGDEESGNEIANSLSDYIYQNAEKPSSYNPRPLVLKAISSLQACADSQNQKETAQRACEPTK